MLFDVLMDTVLDSVKMLPFLLAAFLLMEWLEKYSGEYMNRMLAKVGHAGSRRGSIAGLHSPVRFFCGGGESVRRGDPYAGNASGSFSCDLG